VTDDEKKKLDELLNALLVTQPGQREPLLTQLARMQQDWSRLTWAGRAMLVLLASAGGILAGWEKMTQGIKWLIALTGGK